MLRLDWELAREFGKLSLLLLPLGTILSLGTLMRPRKELLDRHNGD